MPKNLYLMCAKIALLGPLCAAVSSGAQKGRSPFLLSGENFTLTFFLYAKSHPQNPADGLLLLLLLLTPFAFLCSCRCLSFPLPFPLPCPFLHSSRNYAHFQSLCRRSCLLLFLFLCDYEQD